MTLTLHAAIRRATRNIIRTCSAHGCRSWQCALPLSSKQSSADSNLASNAGKGTEYQSECKQLSNSLKLKFAAGLKEQLIWGGDLETVRVQLTVFVSNSMH